MPRIPRKTVIVAAVAVGLVALLFGQSIIFHIFPAFAFRHLTGRPLPPGARVTAYASKMNDNVLRSSHYWQLEHASNGFVVLQQGADFHTYSDDVAGYIAEVRSALAPDLRDGAITQIKQWSRSGRRSQLILQERGELISYYVLSTI